MPPPGVRTSEKAKASQVAKAMLFVEPSAALVEDAEEQETSVSPSGPTLEVLWHEQPDWLNSSLLARAFDVAHANAQVSNGSGYGGVNALTGGSIDAYVIKYFRDQNDFHEFGFGQRIKVNAAPDDEVIVLAAVDGTGAIQVCCTIREDMKVSIWRGAMDDLLATSTNALDTGAELRFGFKGEIDSANGVAEVYVDGEVLVRIEGEDTAPASSGNFRGVYIGLFPSYFVSHMYGGQTNGALIPAYLVKVLWPDGPGTTEWDTNTSELTWQVLEEIIADEDTSYIYATGLLMRYAVSMQPMHDTPIIYGSRSIATVRNIANPLYTASYEPGIRLDADGAMDFDTWRSVVQEAWRCIDRFDRTSPFTGAPFTTSSLNATSDGGRTQA